MADGLTLVGGAELQATLRAMPDKVARRVRKQSFSKTSLFIRRHLRGAAPQGATGHLRRSIGINRGRTSHWVGLNKPTPGRKKGFRGSSNIRYYYKTLDQITRRGRPLRPWFELAIEAVEGRVANEMLNAAKSSIRIEAGRAHQLAKRLGGRRGGPLRGGRF